MGYICGSGQSIFHAFVLKYFSVFQYFRLINQMTVSVLLSEGETEALKEPGEEPGC